MRFNLSFTFIFLTVLAGCATASDDSAKNTAVETPPQIASPAPAVVTSAEPVQTPAKAVDVATGASWRPLGPNEIISADNLRKMQLAGVDVLILDARDKTVYDTAHIEGAKTSLPAEFYREMSLFKKGVIAVPPDPDQALEQAMKGIPKDKPLVTYCNVGCKASAALFLKLKGLGFTNVLDMEEGLQSWQGKGYPVSIGTTGLSSDTVEELQR